MARIRVQVSLTHSLDGLKCNTTYSVTLFVVVCGVCGVCGV